MSSILGHYIDLKKTEHIVVMDSKQLKRDFGLQLVINLKRCVALNVVYECCLLCSSHRHCL